jgi:hypothetical protein
MPLRLAEVPPTPDPVFVLSAARSGSTLLRFLLDAHPLLACPAETGLPDLCAQQAAAWSVLVGEPVPKDRTVDPSAIPDDVLAGIRHTVLMMTDSCLARRDAVRYCDKSLGAAWHVRLLARVFPGAKFVCLYRHPMDVVASGIEACPWGLGGYGFDSYSARFPGNAVRALAQYWTDHTAAILAAEEEFPDRCHRVRYEDLVADPEGVTERIFQFIGVRPVPGISAACFAPERDRLGPADYKIWHTSQVSTGSVGRGWFVPAGMIGREATTAINELADKLSYLRVDETWSVADAPPDLRVFPDGPPAPAAPPDDDARQIPRAYLILGDRLQSGLLGISDRFAQRWGARSAESFLVIATMPTTPGDSVRWRVDLAARTATLTAALTSDTASAAWRVIGAADTWERVLAGTANLNVSLRRRELRYCDAGDGTSATVARIGMLADLLGITSWQSTELRPIMA